MNFQRIDRTRGPQPGPWPRRVRGPGVADVVATGRIPPTGQPGSWCSDPTNDQRPRWRRRTYRHHRPVGL